MSRKDYKLLAGAFNETLRYFADSVPGTQPENNAHARYAVSKAVQKTMRALHSDNPRFDDGNFLGMVWEGITNLELAG